VLASSVKPTAPVAWNTCRPVLVAGAGAPAVPAAVPVCRTAGDGVVAAGVAAGVVTGVVVTGVVTGVVAAGVVTGGVTGVVTGAGVAACTGAGAGGGVGKKKLAITPALV